MALPAPNPTETRDRNTPNAPPEPGSSHPDSLTEPATQAQTQPAPMPAAATEATLGLGAMLGELINVLLLAAVMFLGIRSVVQNFRIDGISMLPNFHDGEYLLVNRFAYCPGLHVDVPALNVQFDRQVCLWKPQRGDVIVFRYPRDPSSDYIKRVIGLPGETVAIRNGQVFINGEPLAENFGPARGSYSTNGPVTVGPDEYYVLGDNRNNSSDSHAWGTLPNHFIVGKAWLLYWPVSEIGFVPHAKLSVAAASN